MYIYIYCIVIRGPQVHQSLNGGIRSIRQGRAPQRTTTTECTPMLCMALFQLLKPSKNNNWCFMDRELTLLLKYSNLSVSALN